MSQVSSTNMQTDLTIQKLNYLKMRFEDTSTSTKMQSRLVYFVDGAVLAFFYVVIKALGISRSIILVCSFPLIVLALINFIHSEFIYVQRNWLHTIDNEFCKLLGIDKIIPPKTRNHFISAHGSYRLIHALIGATLLIAAIIMFMYGMEVF